jgi:hypothetical protein
LIDTISADVDSPGFALLADIFSRYTVYFKTAFDIAIFFHMALISASTHEWNSSTWFAAKRQVSRFQ